ncbi:hypothetical protein BJ741DRAFT_583046 [Chytriomyces cf. hyalinus JEL632]|nr:hypothetical protein BJ741DRAFT_583046 [Chytriomyces cf. hyalinus JEL632]
MLCSAPPFENWTIPIKARFGEYYLLPSWRLTIFPQGLCIILFFPTLFHQGRKWDSLCFGQTGKVAQHLKKKQSGQPKTFSNTPERRNVQQNQLLAERDQDREREREKEGRDREREREHEQAPENKIEKSRGRKNGRKKNFWSVNGISSNSNTHSSSFNSVSSSDLDKFVNTTSGAAEQLYASHSQSAPQSIDTSAPVATIADTQHFNLLDKIQHNCKPIHILQLVLDTLASFSAPANLAVNENTSNTDASNIRVPDVSSIGDYSSLLEEATRVFPDWSTERICIISPSELHKCLSDVVVTMFLLKFSDLLVYTTSTQL